MSAAANTGYGHGGSLLGIKQYSETQRNIIIRIIKILVQEPETYTAYKLAKKLGVSISSVEAALYKIENQGTPLMEGPTCDHCPEEGSTAICRNRDCIRGKLSIYKAPPKEEDY